MVTRARPHTCRRSAWTSTCRAMRRRWQAEARELRLRPAAAAPCQSSPAGAASRSRPSRRAARRRLRDLDWDELRAAVAACQRCELHATRTQTVFGVGNPQARWMFIGEAPGAEEDRQGEPFVGRAGQLLTSMLRALGLRREDVFIANVLKCRPPEQSRPEAGGGGAAAAAYLERQIALVDPTLMRRRGAHRRAEPARDRDAASPSCAARCTRSARRRWPLVVTYHPAYLLRSPGEKRKAWQDLRVRAAAVRAARTEPASGGRA